MNSQRKQQMLLHYYRIWLNTSIGNSLVRYLTKNGITSIGIYGFGEVGQALYAQLKDAGFSIAWVMDIRKADICLAEPVVDINDNEIGDTDIVLVTVLDTASRIEVIENLKSKLKLEKVVSFFSILDTLHFEAILDSDSINLFQDRLMGYLFSRNIINIAIVGQSEIAERIECMLSRFKIERIKDSNLEITDKKDLIIVLFSNDYLEIEKEIASQHRIPVISLEDLLGEI